MGLPSWEPTPTMRSRVELVWAVVTWKVPSGESKATETPPSSPTETLPPVMSEADPLGSVIVPSATAPSASIETSPESQPSTAPPDKTA